MSTLQHDEAMIQALAITKAQAGVRSMSCLLYTSDAADEL